VNTSQTNNTNITNNINSSANNIHGNSNGGSKSSSRDNSEEEFVLIPNKDKRAAVRSLLVQEVQYLFIFLVVQNALIWCCNCGVLRVVLL